MQVERDAVTGLDTTGHEWDGIKELDRPVPRPVVWIYLIAIVGTLVWWVLYPSIPFVSDYYRGIMGTTSRETVLDRLDAAEVTRVAFEQELIDRDLNDLVADAGVRERHEAAAAVLFNDNCAACHGTDLQGQPNFPNLVDDAWLYSDDLDDIVLTLRYGINDAHEESRYNEMLAYGRERLLDDAQMSDVTEFVLSLSGADHDSDAASRGAEVYASECTTCHGDGGAGLGDGAPNLTDDYWIYGGTREAILDVLYDGRLGHMPAWEDRLSEAEIRKLALYLQWSRENGKDGD